MILFFSPILEHFFPLFVQIAQMGLILPKWVSFFPEYHPHPLFFTQPSHTPYRYMYLHNTPPSPPQNTPLHDLNLKVGKMNYSLGNLDPIWAKGLKSGQNFSRSGQNYFTHLGQGGCWTLPVSTRYRRQLSGIAKASPLCWRRPQPAHADGPRWRAQGIPKHASKLEGQDSSSRRRWSSKSPELKLKTKVLVKDQSKRPTRELKPEVSVWTGSAGRSMNLGSFHLSEAASVLKIGSLDWKVALDRRNNKHYNTGWAKLSLKSCNENLKMLDSLYSYEKVLLRKFMWDGQILNFPKK